MVKPVERFADGEVPRVDSVEFEEDSTGVRLLELVFTTINLSFLRPQKLSLKVLSGPTIPPNYL
ncbi:hypothetical protein A3F65_01650 [Candidatus Saccharibacteria bacterium RIFCSPHIGHO2_12_FULL_47_16b]|nr:MAG: hypothetical protein A3F65_01650 [Candidatus Saccharibacteria bacterium RIFCSPHIGHO2_12_FULL_47_16b]